MFGVEKKYEVPAGPLDLVAVNTVTQDSIVITEGKKGTRPPPTVPWKVRPPEPISRGRWLSPPRRAVGLTAESGAGRGAMGRGDP